MNLGLINFSFLGSLIQKSYSP